MKKLISKSLFLAILALSLQSCHKKSEDPTPSSARFVSNNQTTPPQYIGDSIGDISINKDIKRYLTKEELMGRNFDYVMMTPIDLKGDTLQATYDLLPYQQSIKFNSGDSLVFYVKNKDIDQTTKWEYDGLILSRYRLPYLVGDKPFGLQYVYIDHNNYIVMVSKYIEKQPYYISYLRGYLR